MNRIVLGRQKVRDRRKVRDDLFGLFLDLPHALKIADRGRVIFDAGAKQRCERRMQLRRQPFQSLDFYDLPALDAVDRRPRNAELFRNLIRGLAAADPVRFEAAPDLAQLRHRPSIRLSHNLDEIAYSRQWREIKVISSANARSTPEGSESGSQD